MKIKQSISAFASLADETRLRILNLLSERELCVCDLMKVLKVPQSKMSRHLSYLRRAGLVKGRKQGLWMYYRLAPRAPKAVLFALEHGRLEFKEFKMDLQAYDRSKGCLVACCK